MELTAIRTLKLEIEATEQKLLALRENAQSITAKLDGLRRCLSLAVLSASLVLRYFRQIQSLAAIIRFRRRLFERQIFLPSTLATANAAIVLYRRYILCETFKEIASAMNYSEYNIYHLHRQGVRSFS